MFKKKRKKKKRNQKKKSRGWGGWREEKHTAPWAAAGQEIAKAACKSRLWTGRAGNPPGAEKAQSWINTSQVELQPTSPFGAPADLGQPNGRDWLSISAPFVGLSYMLSCWKSHWTIGSHRHKTRATCLLSWRLQSNWHLPCQVGEKLTFLPTTGKGTKVIGRGHTT